MQTIAIYLNVDGHVATAVDEYNAVRGTPPALMRGVRVLLCLRMVDTEGNPGDAEVVGITNWEFVLAGDWNTATDPEIRVAEGITVVQTTVGTKIFNEIQIPLTEMNTEELITKLGNSANADLGAELVGFDDGVTDPGFLIQFTMRVCNRRSTAGTGTPTQVADGMYTAAQINSLLANYYTSVQVDAMTGNFALTSHNHDGIYAAASHTHAISDIADLSALLDGKAAAHHNHDTAYASLSHNHGMPCQAGSEITPGMLVYLDNTAESLVCHLATNSSSGKHFADGYVAELDSGAALVKTSGLMALTNSLPAGSEIFLGLDGAIAVLPPTESGDLVQKVGRVLNGNQVFFAISSGREII